MVDGCSKWVCSGARDEVGDVEIALQEKFVLLADWLCTSPQGAGPC